MRTRVPDPKKWHFDPESGEYFRITGYHKGQVMVDPTPYKERFAADYRAAHGRRTMAWQFFGGLVAGYCSYEWLHINADFKTEPLGYILLAFLVLVCSTLCVVGSVLAFLILIPVILFSGDRVGPRPARPRGEEEVEQQKVHGDGGFLTGADLDAALGGQTQKQRPPDFRF